MFFIFFHIRISIFLINQLHNFYNLEVLAHVIDYIFLIIILFLSFAHEFYGYYHPNEEFNLILSLIIFSFI
jgi:hypothetical protein